MHLVLVHTGRLSGVLFCILFGLITLSAQTATLTTVHGRVSDTLNTPLPYASVQVDGEEIGVRTDIDGYFYFQSKKHPKFVKIAYVGYKSQKVKINPDVHNELEIKLLEETYGIQEVTIRPKKSHSGGFQTQRSEQKGRARLLQFRKIREAGVRSE
jgi:hypothetical protein